MKAKQCVEGKLNLKFVKTCICSYRSEWRLRCAIGVWLTKHTNWSLSFQESSYPLVCPTHQTVWERPAGARRRWRAWDACMRTDIWYSQWVWFLHPSCGGSVWLLPDSYHGLGHRSKTQTHSDPTSLHTNQKTHTCRATFTGRVYPKTPLQSWLNLLKHKKGFGQNF